MTQGPLEVSVQEELDGVLRWIQLPTYTTFTNGCTPITTWSHVLPEHSIVT